MFLGQVLVLSFINVLMVLFVNSFPQNSDTLHDSISLKADRDPGPNNQPIGNEDATGSPNDSTSQIATDFFNDDTNRDLISSISQCNPYSSTRRIKERDTAGSSINQEFDLGS